MSNKKSCENCVNKLDSKNIISAVVNCSGTKLCSHWKRNNLVWLNLPPEHEGWFWWQLSEKDESTVLHLQRRKIDFELALADCINMLIKDREGQWQGPITPHA